MTNNRLKLNASKPNSSGLVRLVVWPDVRSSRSGSTGIPFFHPRQSATQESSWIRLWVFHLTSPSWQVLCTFTYVSCVRSVKRSPMMHATLSSGPSFFRDWIIAMGSLPKHRTIFWFNSPVWCVLLPDSSSSYLEKVTLLTPSIASSTGLTSRNVFVLKYAFSRVGAFTGSAPSYLSKYCIPVSSIAGRSHLRSAASGDLFILTTNTVTIGPRAFAVACPAGLQHGTVFRQNFMTKAWVWWRSERSWKLIYSKSASKLLCDFDAWCKSLLTNEHAFVTFLEKHVNV